MRFIILLIGCVSQEGFQSHRHFDFSSQFLGGRFAKQIVTFTPRLVKPVISRSRNVSGGHLRPMTRSDNGLVIVDDVLEEALHKLWTGKMRGSTTTLIAALAANANVRREFLLVQPGEDVEHHAP